MSTMGKFYQPRTFATIFLIGWLSLPCGLFAQKANKPVWCMKTDKGQYIEMSRVKMLAGVDEKKTFEIIVHEGDGVIGVESVTFEKHEIDPTITPVVVKGDANGDGFVDKSDIPEVVNNIISNTYSDVSDINSDGKVNVVDMVALVNIVNAPKAGARGILTPFGQKLSVSDDLPGTIIPDDDSGRRDPDDVQEPRDPDPGTVDTQDDPEPRDPEPDQPDPQDEPGTIETEPEPIAPQEDPGTLEQSVPYFRVQFTENLKQVKVYAADGTIFFNPAYNYLDFKYSLPFTHGSLSGNIDADTPYYIGVGPDSKDRTRFSIAKTDGSPAIKKIWAYNQPVRFITVSTEGMSRDKAGQKTITYTFNALPQNMEELRTLEVNNRAYFASPHFVTALFICCLNRITENSADAWEMINYLHTHTAIAGQDNITKVSNADMQDMVQHLLDNDDNGYPASNSLSSYFAGSSPDNQYTPTIPYQVTVVEKSDAYSVKDNVEYCNLHVESNGFDDLMGPLKLQKNADHGWLIYSGDPVFTKKMKSQN